MPKLKTFGNCSVCKSEVEVQSNGLFKAMAVSHEFKALPCRGTNYTCHNTKFLIETPEEAKQVAEFLKYDTEVCLDGMLGTGMHTVNCGGGSRCQETRQKLAKAFAMYFIEYCVAKTEVAA